MYIIIIKGPEVFKMKKIKEFEGLLSSEIKKAEAAANKALGRKDCKVTGYFAKETHPFDFDPDLTFVDVRCEICYGYGGDRADVDIMLSVPMFDRRRTTARVAM